MKLITMRRTADLRDPPPADADDGSPVQPALTVNQILHILRKYPRREAARRLGISFGAVCKWRHKYGVRCDPKQHVKMTWNARWDTYAANALANGWDVTARLSPTDVAYMNVLRDRGPQTLAALVVILGRERESVKKRVYRLVRKGVVAATGVRVRASSQYGLTV